MQANWDPGIHNVDLRPERRDHTDGNRGNISGSIIERRTAARVYYTYDSLHTSSVSQSQHRNHEGNWQGAGAVCADRQLIHIHPDPCRYLQYPIRCH